MKKKILHKSKFKKDAWCPFKFRLERKAATRPTLGNSRPHQVRPQCPARAAVLLPFYGEGHVVRHHGMRHLDPDHGLLHAPEAEPIDRTLDAPISKYALLFFFNLSFLHYHVVT